MTRVRPLLLAAALLLSVPPARSYAESNVNAKVLLHLASPTSKNACTRREAHPSCSSIVTSGNLHPASYFAYVLVADAEACAGVSGMRFGIDYNLGVTIYDWKLCADTGLYSPFWPEPGSGATIVWNLSTNCQKTEPAGPGTGVMATVGYFYVAAYSPDHLRIAPHPSDGRVSIGDCEAVDHVIAGGGIPENPSPLGLVAFSAGAHDAGYNPCGSIVHPPACSLTGPGYLVSGTSTSYVFSDNTCTSGYQWIISGNATITTSTTKPSVTVLAGNSSDPFTLTMTVGSGPSAHSCSKTVDVVLPLLPCEINGAGSIMPSETGYYNATPVTDGTYQWSVLGNATLREPTNEEVVRVAVGAPGTFELHLTVSRFGQTSSCFKTITVEYPQDDCLIYGPDTVLEGPSRSLFAVNPGSDKMEWAVTGNATLVGPVDRSVVQVVPGDAPLGSFLLTMTFTWFSPFRSLTCYHQASVVPGPPSSPARNANAKILVHLASPLIRGVCAASQTAPRCNDIATAGSLYPKNYFAMVLVTDGVTDGSENSGIAGADFGIDYNSGPGAGVDIFDFILCASYHVPSPTWPAPGSGDRILWDVLDNRCQKLEPAGPGTGVVARAGYLYLSAYTPDVLRITPHPEDGKARVLDCSGYESILPNPAALGTAVFSQAGNESGYNPCGLVIKVRSTTWSAIKTMYR